VSEIEYFEHEGVQFALIRGGMTRTQHVGAQEVLNRALEPLAIASLSDPYSEQFDEGGYRIDVRLPGPARAVLVDVGPPFQRWEWADNDYVCLAFDMDAGLHHIPVTGKDVHLVMIDDRAFHASLVADESTQRFGANLYGFLRERLGLTVHIIAPSSERRDQIIAGIASMRVVASPDGCV
jgi:hypothetical protein